MITGLLSCAMARKDFVKRVSRLLDNERFCFLPNCGDDSLATRSSEEEGFRLKGFPEFDVGGGGGTNGSLPSRLCF